MIKGLEHFSCEDRVRELRLEQVLLSDLINMHKYLNVKSKEDQSQLFSAHWQNNKQWTQTETQKVPSEHQNPLFYREGDWALAQAAQVCYGVSILGNIPKLSGYSPGQPRKWLQQWMLDAMNPDPCQLHNPILR